MNELKAARLQLAKERLAEVFAMTEGPGVGLDVKESLDAFFRQHGLRVTYARDPARLPWNHPEHRHDGQCAISCNTMRDEAGLPRNGGA